MNIQSATSLVHYVYRFPPCPAGGRSTGQDIDTRASLSGATIYGAFKIAGIRLRVGLVAPMTSELITHRVSYHFHALWWFPQAMLDCEEAVADEDPMPDRGHGPPSSGLAMTLTMNFGGTTPATQYITPRATRPVRISHLGRKL